jgi:hypothetical protein
MIKGRTVTRAVAAKRADCRVLKHFGAQRPLLEATETAPLALAALLRGGIRLVGITERFGLI